jgi:hypothetical protein
MPRGWRLEEQVRLFPAARLPGVRVQRIEDVDESFLPRSLHYRELGEAGEGPEGPPAYETMRQGPVEAGAWRYAERENGRARDASLALPAGTTSPLAARESLVRTTPRTAGLARLSIVDPASATLKSVRAGFASLGGVPAGGGDADDVLRWEEGETALESRWKSASAGGVATPRCLSEQVTPGVVATIATEAQAEAAAAKASAEGAARELVIEHVGVSLSMPGASWTGEALPPRPGDVGSRAVGRLQSRLLASDVRVEWDPKAASSSGTTAGAPAAEAALMVRLRGVAPDLAVVEPRGAVESLPGAWRMALEGTVRGERVRTLVLVADRGEGRVTLLATCPSSAWADARPALEAILASFRWL